MVISNTFCNDIGQLEELEDAIKLHAATVKLTTEKDLLLYSHIKDLPQ